MTAPESIVDQAEQALRDHGDLTYQQAKETLAVWHLNDKLTVAQRAEVLRRFTHVDLVIKCAECGELVEHYAGEPAHVFHHLGWPNREAS